MQSLLQLTYFVFMIMAGRPTPLDPIRTYSVLEAFS